MSSDQCNPPKPSSSQHPTYIASPGPVRQPRSLKPEIVIGALIWVLSLDSQGNRTFGAQGVFPGLKVCVWGGPHSFSSSMLLPCLRLVFWSFFPLLVLCPEALQAEQRFPNGHTGKFPQPPYIREKEPMACNSGEAPGSISYWQNQIGRHGRWSQLRVIL
jgi:hypothetical protein